MEKKFQFNDAEISYTILGAGKPVVLLHGFGEDHNIWNKQLSSLQDHCQLILPDLPGSGKSTMLQKENTSIEDYAACIKALIDNENIFSCIILGHSLGGYITLAFAEKYGENVKAFGLIHSTAFADNDEKKSVRKKGIRFITEHGAYFFLKNTTPNLFAENFKNQHAEEIAALIEQGKYFKDEALIQYYMAMMNRRDTTDVLSKVNVPVLFIMGSEDVAAPLDDLLKQVHLPKISYIHILNGVGHMSMMEAPEQLSNHIGKFIRAME